MPKKLPAFYQRKGHGSVLPGTTAAKFSILSAHFITNHGHFTLRLILNLSIKDDWWA
jgi:hypothetical protein